MVRHLKFEDMDFEVFKVTSLVVWLNNTHKLQDSVLQLKELDDVDRSDIGALLEAVAEEHDEPLQTKDGKRAVYEFYSWISSKIQWWWSCSE